ncbi:hypothetical protein ACRAWF_16070 [Streptomyces sp. L7]
MPRQREYAFARGAAARARRAPRGEGADDTTFEAGDLRAAGVPGAVLLLRIWRRRRSRYRRPALLARDRHRDRRPRRLRRRGLTRAARAHVPGAPPGSADPRPEPMARSSTGTERTRPPHRRPGRAARASFLRRPQATSTV